MEKVNRFFAEILQDNRTGKFSHAKVIAVLGFFAATIFIWKLIIMGTIGIDFFTVYLVYCTGTQTINKWIDKKSAAPKE